MSVELGSGFAAEYRYFTTDLVSNTLIAEIPFNGVSYERAIKGAGKFSGNVPVIDRTTAFNIYDATMPGKTGLYITRNGECVWGGIIWSRNYNLVSQELDVDAAEFTSYFYHRRIWKTWTHEYGATLVVSGGVATVNLDPGFQFNSVAGSLVRVIFREVSNFRYNGEYTITARLSSTSFTFSAGSIPNGTYPLTTIYARVDTYDYIRSLIDAVSVDFTGIEFPNADIEPGLGLRFTVTNKRIASGQATLTTSQPHNVNPGQVVLIRNVDATFNGQYIVTATPSATEIQYAKTGSLGSTAVSVNTKTVVTKLLSNYVATLTTATVHGFSVGQEVVISGVDDANSPSEIFNGEFIITAATSNTFSYLTGGVTNVPSTSVNPGATAVVTPYVLSGSYGPYSANSDIQIEFNDDGFSGVAAEPLVYRGFEIKNVGKELDVYSDSIDGFEYRVDCFYDPGSASFRREFMFLPIDFPNPPAPGEISPISRFGADQLVFEYPGNITDIQIDEKADDAATRFWMVGNIPDLGDDASQPYAAAAATDLLLQGWPLLEEDDSADDVSDERTLYEGATRFLSEFRPPIGDIKITVNGSLSPTVGSYAPGDWCSIIADDEFVKMRLASDLEPRDTVIVRKIDSIKVSVPDSPTFPEKVTLDLIAEWEVDKRG
jgi:hypothetical protein